MKVTPLLMQPDMVRATLREIEAPGAGQSQTRCVVKPQPAGAWAAPGKTACPYGHPGGLLYVRETWKYWDWTEDGMPWIKYAADDSTKIFDSCTPEEWGERLEEIWATLSLPENYNIDGRARDRKWRPSIFMPRWASRITLELTEVRVERVQDISEADALAEGITRTESTGGCANYWYSPASKKFPSAREVFRELWDSINAAPKPIYQGGVIVAYESFPWEDIQEVREHRGKQWYVHGNPWVWPLTFTPHLINVDRYLENKAA